MTVNQPMLKGTTSFWMSWLAIAMTFVSASVTLPFAPEMIPTHWGINGEPDATGSALFGLMVVPAIAIALQLLALLLPYIDPGKKNYANFQKAYWRIFLAIQVYLFALQLLLGLWAVGWKINMSVAMPILIGSLFVVLGNYFGKLRPNWMMGIRTPWTLSSKLSWDKTHRLGGWLMMLMGLVFAGLAFNHSVTSFIAVGVIFVVCISFMIVYSWYIWRSDPARIPASGVAAAEPDHSSSDRTLMLSLLVGTALTWTCDSSLAIEPTKDENSASVEVTTDTGKLFAKLDLPSDVQKACPVLLVLPGSGPTDADGNSPGALNHSLKLLGKGIASRGIAVCRIDKRGVGRSAAAIVKESDLRFETYISDVVDWIKHLKSDQRFSEVHLLGHSEGALIATIAAQQEKVASVISLAGTGRTASDLMRIQLKPKLPPALMQTADDILKKLEAGEQVSDVALGLHVLFRPSVQPYLISWLRYDPAKEIEKLKEVPLLIVQGSTDIQCSIEDAEILAAHASSATKVIIPGMNHVLKKIEGKTVQSQLVAYTDPSLPLHEDLVPEVIRFIEDE